MSILSFIGDIFKPASDLVDNLNTSDEERLILRNQLAEIQASLNEKMIELEKAKIDALSKIQIAEVSSDSAFTRTYRPAIITGMFILISLNSFGVLTTPLPDVFLTVFGASFGVVGIGRSLEKIKRITNGI